VLVFSRPRYWEVRKHFKGKNRPNNGDVGKPWIELFGGQIAETEACLSSFCRSVDISRIDELTRLIVGLSGKSDPESVWFELEDVAESIFQDRCYRDAIAPIAEFLHQQVMDGFDIISCADLEFELDKYVPKAPKGGRLKKILSFGWYQYKSKEWKTHSHNMIRMDWPVVFVCHQYRAKLN